MALKRTSLGNIQTVTGIVTVGIFTAGVSATPVGIASTTYIKGALFHNSGLSTCKTSMYVYPDTTPITGTAVTAYRILSVDMNPSETFSFEPSYPIVLTGSDSIALEVSGTGDFSGISSSINVLLVGDTDISS